MTTSPTEFCFLSIPFDSNFDKIKDPVSSKVVVTLEDIVIDEVIGKGIATSVAFEKKGKDEKMSIEANLQL
jgi:hypothetical protein